MLEDFAVTTAGDGETALSEIHRLNPDVVVLDVMLPGLDGFTVCDRIRADDPVPILMLSARDTVPDRVAGLAHGADDYLVKPFAIEELLARLRALLRRRPEPDATIGFADIVVDVRGRLAFRAGEPLPLTSREYDLLLFFVRHPRQAVSREQLRAQVWGDDFEGASNFVDVAVKELRKKIEVNGWSRLLQTARGFGYILREEQPRAALDRPTWQPPG